MHLSSKQEGKKKILYHKNQEKYIVTKIKKHLSV